MPADATPHGQLRDALQRLALAGAEQQSLFGAGPEDPGALAAEFDRCAVAVLGGAEIEPPLREAIVALSRKLETMSRDGAEFDADLWTETAVRTSEHWADVRRLAAVALETVQHA